jgi:predicted MFS family arabinose efflux permease
MRSSAPTAPAPTGATCPRLRSICSTPATSRWRAAGPRSRRSCATSSVGSFLDRSRRRRAPAGIPAAFLALACGLAVSSVYYAQPLLDAIAASFGVGEGSIGSVVTAAQLGYALGLVAIVPLGDMLEPRRLILILLLASAGALVAVALAPSSAALLVAMFLLGLPAVVVQVIVAFAATLAPPEERGAVVGSVTSGVVVGILLARTFAGGVTQLFGWEAVYLTSAGLTLVVIVVLVRVLPRREGGGVVNEGYLGLIHSTFHLYRSQPLLRQRAALALLAFGAFSVLWTSLVLPLSAPPLLLSNAAVGAFGLVGAAGAIAASRAGRLVDEGRERFTTASALVLMLFAWLPIALLEHSLWALGLGLVMIDLGLQALHVSSQTLLYALDSHARSRLVAAYMLFYSLGSAAGAIASTATYAAAGWLGVCALGASLSLGALALWARSVYL